MSIEYTYEIVRVDEPARCMEIVFTSAGRETTHIGARLPFEGEALEDVVKMYAPIRYWQDQERQMVAPAVGATGSLVYTDPEPTHLVATDAQPTVEGAQTL